MEKGGEVHKPSSPLKRGARNIIVCLGGGGGEF